MTDYLRLRLRQTLRTVAVSLPGRMLAFAVAGLVLAAGIQFFVLGEAARTPLGAVSPSGRLQAEVGYAVLLLAALSLVTGSQSSRFPCTPADVAWVYASPIPTRHIVFAQLVWQAGRRCVFWVLGGVVVDVVFTVALDSDAGLFLSRAVLATPLLVALVSLSVGAGSTRGSTAPARVTVGLGVALGTVVLTPLLLEVVTGSTARDAVEDAALSPLARSLGAVLFGQYDAAAAAALAAMAVLGAALCRAGGPGLREQLTLDAAFWADFSMTSMRTPVREPKPSFRTLSMLQGPWSLLWFEVAVLRRANYQRWSLVVLLVTSLLTGAFAPEFVPLFVFAAPLGVVTGAYLSGVARHLRLRTLLLVPGSLVSRVVAVEALPAALAGFGLVVGLAVGGGIGGYGAGDLATLGLQGVVLLVIAFATRITAAAVSFRDGVVAGGLFHLNLTVLTAAAAGTVVALSWLATKADAPMAPSLVVLLAVASALLGAALRLFAERVDPASRRQPAGVSPAAARPR